MLAGTPTEVGVGPDCHIAVIEQLTVVVRYLGTGLTDHAYTFSGSYFSFSP
jgi:hypothetical protein